jgi:tetratricopeptide (TPR) repeat protein
MDRQGRRLRLERESSTGGCCASRHRKRPPCRPRRGFQLAWALDTVLHRQGRWHERAGAWPTALPAARRLPHPAAAHTHRSLGQATTTLDDYERAHTHLHRALHLYTEAGDLFGQAHAHLTLGVLWERRGRPEQALDQPSRPSTSSRPSVTAAPRGRAQHGWCRALLGNHTAALAYCQQALTLHQQIGERWGQAAAWDSLGYAHHDLGRHTDAAHSYSADLSHYIGDRAWG